MVPALFKFSPSLICLTLTCCGASAGGLDEWNVNNLEPDCHGMTNAIILSFASGNNTLVAVGTQGTILSSADGVDWNLARTSGSLSNAYTTISDITFANGLFVGVGYQYVPYGRSNYVWTSTDAVHWQQFNQLNAIQGITFGNDIFVGVNAAGQILTSTNGTYWQFQGNPTTNSLNRVAFGNGVFVAVGHYTMLTSMDGTNWTNVSLTGRIDSIEFVTFVQGQFLVLDGFQNYWSSVDGTNWTSHTVTTIWMFKLTSICATPNSMVIAGYNLGNGLGAVLRLADDRVTWTNCPIANTESLYASTVWNDAVIVAGTRGTISRSQPFSGSKLPPRFLQQPLSQLARTDALAMLNSTAASWPPLAFQWQKEGADIAGMTASSLWLQPALTNSGNYSVVASNSSGSVTSLIATVTRVGPVTTIPPSQLPAVQGGSVGLGVVSSGGGTPAYQWRRNSQTIPGATASSLTIANLQTTDEAVFDVIATNASGSITNAGLVLIVEPYAGHPFFHWQDRSTPDMRATLQSLSPGWFYGVTYGFGNFVVVGAKGYGSDFGAIYTSGDGQNWIRRMEPPPGQQNPIFSLYDVARGNQTFVAVGWNGAIYTSTNAVDWLLRSFQTYSTFSRTIFSNSWFYAYPYGGQVIRSPDGVTWQTASTYPPLGSPSAFGAGYYASLTNTSEGSEILLSTNGANWTIAFVSSNSLADVAYGNGSFVAVGYNGTILQTAPPARLSMTQATTPQISVYGLIGQNYRLEYRQTLKPFEPWSSLATFPLTSNPVVWRDDSPPSNQRFYRALLVP